MPPETAKRIEKIISTERLGSYLTAAGFDLGRALRIYAWNLRISAAFLPLLASVEVGLRNLIAARLSVVHGPDWWLQPTFTGLIGPEGKKIVWRARGALMRRGLEPTGGGMIAQLSFGFWVKMLQEKYEAALWADLCAEFPDMPRDLSCHALYLQCERALSLRNRVGHHEPIFRRDLTRDYAECLEVLRWINAEKAAWIAPHLDVMRLMRQKP